jgi:NAD(P)-dependent dehydrogenase (short-subunit alcohol dehydrogenase family)
MLLANKVAIVTGGAKGMGRGISLKFAQEGAKVAVVDIDIKEAETTVSEVKKIGGTAIAIQCDVTRWSKHTARWISWSITPEGPTSWRLSKNSLKSSGTR